MFEFLFFDENPQILNSFLEACAKVCTGTFLHLPGQQSCISGFFVGQEKIFILEEILLFLFLCVCVCVCERVRVFTHVVSDRIMDFSENANFGNHSLCERAMKSSCLVALV